MTSGLLGRQLFFEGFDSPVWPSASLCLPAIAHRSVSTGLGQRSLIRPFKFPASPYEYAVTALRECPTPESLQLCDTPERAADYWHRHVPQNPYFNPECECLVVLLLNSRHRIKGHQVVTIGTLNTILVEPREVFRLAIVVAAAAIILAHNHPSGDATPSQGDIVATRDLARAGQLLKIELLDHIILGKPNHASLRELGLLSGF